MIQKDITKATNMSSKISKVAYCFSDKISVFKKVSRLNCLLRICSESCRPSTCLRISGQGIAKYVGSVYRFGCIFKGLVLDIAPIELASLAETIDPSLSQFRMQRRKGMPGFEDGYMINSCIADE